MFSLLLKMAHHPMTISAPSLVVWGQHETLTKGEEEGESNPNISYLLSLFKKGNNYPHHTWKPGGKRIPEAI